MNEVLAVILTVLLAFTVADYTLGRALVKDPWRPVVAAVFATLLIIFAGVLALSDIID